LAFYSEEGDFMVTNKKEPVKLKVYTHEKKTVKKHAHEVKGEKHKKKSNKVLLISLIAVAVVLIIAGIAVYMNKDKFFGKVAASVNGEKILLSEVNERFDLYQGAYTKEELLNQTIMEKLLLQEADKKNIEISDEEFNTFLTSLLEANSMTKESLNARLKEQGITYSEFEESYKQRLIIEKLLLEIIKDASVTEQEIADYYASVKDLLPENVTFEEVKDEINQTILLPQKQNEKFSEFIDNLFASSIIVINQELMQEEKQEISEVTSSVSDVSDKNAALAKCLTEKGAKMYGASWCSHCANQKKMFGDAFQYIDYVECDTTGQEECNSAGIEGYPTWTINGQKYPGETSLENLAQLSGCSY